MEFEMKEVVTVTTEKDTLEGALRDLSGNAFKLIVAASLLKLNDWTTVIPPGELGVAIEELVDRGFFFTDDWRLFRMPDLCDKEDVALHKFIK